MSEAPRDQNYVAAALGQSSASSTTTLPFIIDSTTGRLKVDASSGGTWTKETPTGAINGSNVTYTLAHTPIANSMNLVVGNQVFTETTDYSISGTTLTMVTALTVDYASLPFIAQYQY